MDFYKSKKYLSILAVILIIAWLFLMDYSDFSWKTNASTYLGIFSMLCLLFGNYIEYRTKKKKQKD
jgi:hypothetical protein